MKIKLLCISNSNSPRFQKDKLYFADFHGKMGLDGIWLYRPSYWVYDDSRCLGTGGRFYLDKKEPGDRVLEDYFITEKESRRLKLERIYESSGM